MHCNVFFQFCFVMFCLFLFISVKCSLVEKMSVAAAKYQYDVWDFTLLENLPTEHECVLAIVHHSPTYGSAKQKDHLHHFSLRLLTHWETAFGRDTKLTTIKGVKDKLNRLLKEYNSQVQKGHGSKRSNLIQWKQKHHVLFNILGKDVDVESFDPSEKLFFKNQLALNRKMVIDKNKIDEEHESMIIEIEREEEEEREMDISVMDESAAMMNSTLDDSNMNLNFSVNRSGRVRAAVSCNEVGVQTDMSFNLRQGCKTFTDSIKIALAASSSAANISPEAARVAYKVATEKHLGLSYVLEAEVDKDRTEPPSKRPHTEEQYFHYKNVLPSPKTIRKMKHLMAIQAERNAALALLDTTPSDVVTFHYDTTTRKRLNGEWPSLVIQTSSGKKFRLRSLNMAVEDRRNIVNLFLASLNRLSLTVGCNKSLIWEKLTAVMTDSVQKNLQIEQLIAASLSSNHVPLHLLCVSHTCEAFDAGNLLVLKDIEEKADLKGKVCQRKPSLRSFLSKGVVVAAINAFCKLVSNDGHKSSIHEEFDDLLSKRNKTKKFSLYKERRFALLGYSAAALIHHFDDLKATLDATGSANQLVQACELYMQIDYIRTSLQCLAWFTYKITLPFLNMCEMENPKSLLRILPALHDDLANCQMETLAKYKVNYSFDVSPPDSPLGVHIINRFCKQGAADLKRQRGREYGIVAVDENNKRATDLTKVDPLVAEKLPDHNLVCERDLSRMDKLAIRAAACSNRKFTASGMKDDMTLYQTNISSIEKETRAIARLLDAEEQKWFEAQREITKQKLAEKHRKAVHSKERSTVLLGKCKEHSGPFASVEEVESALQGIQDEKTKKTMLRNELLFRKLICKHDFQENPELYKVNGMSEKQMKLNLGILLSGNHDQDANEEVSFPDDNSILMSCATNDDQSASVDDVREDVEIQEESEEIPLNEPCAAVWDTSLGRNWYIGMTRGKVDENNFRVEYLECVNRDSTRRSWRYPVRDDEHNTSLIQIIPCNVLGSWDMSSRQTKFEVENWEVIEGLFQSMYK